MRTHLFLVRHAHSIYTPDEFSRPLSEQGFADAERITQILQNENIDLVISSPYKRAIQTVEGIAKMIKKEIFFEDGFKERILSEKPVEDFHAAIAKVWEDAHFSWDGGESNILAQERGIEATNRILKKYEGENIVVGTHGNIMVLIMNHFDKKYDYQFWQELDMPDIYKLTFEKNELKEVMRIWDKDK
ncbi:histidine phosphatase family protein [Cytobacillus dafuensis]|uniref:Histidine phosphatase family protein n=1 Tax=Cytobacillus dafuensis TaxID=1742359 RepID=A0A5B8Z094_CYTDA|nr:histidine phosphatase family protein [Cytobacillus dafuensis]QED46298.1 histidine phosphatase family protein [Cytobacillus dafuensis]